MNMQTLLLKALDEGYTFEDFIESHLLHELFNLSLSRLDIITRILQRRLSEELLIPDDGGNPDVINLLNEKIRISKPNYFL